MADSAEQVPGTIKTEEAHPVPETGAAPAMPEEPNAANPEEPSAEKPEEKKPGPEYDIVPSKRLEPESSFAPDHYRPLVTAAGAGGQGKSAAGKEPRLRLSNASLEKLGKLGSSQTWVYAVIGVGLGLLVGLVAAVIFLHPGGSGGPSDMGTVNANEYGLKANLTAEWKDKLEYHLTVEPSAPEQVAGFMAAVTSSPRPLSISIQMKDPFGAVMCSDTILLKYDPRNAPGMTVADPGPMATKAEQAIAARNQIAQGLNLARLEGQELDREHAKNIFQNDVAPNGQVASISAVGVLPCTKKQFDSIASWGLTADFPIVVQPVKSANSSGSADANGGDSSADKTEAKKALEAAKARRRPAPPEPPIYIEGDDAIMFVDSSNGIIETREGKTLMLDKSDPILNALKGQDFPIPIHYRCDQTGNCTLAGVNTGVHRARLKR